MLRIRVDDRPEAANRLASSGWPATTTWPSDFSNVSAPACVNVANRLLSVTALSNALLSFQRVMCLVDATAVND